MTKPSKVVLRDQVAMLRRALKPLAQPRFVTVKGIVEYHVSPREVSAARRALERSAPQGGQDG